MIENDLVECVIGLGPNLFYNSPMESCLLISITNKPEVRKDKILFINAVKELVISDGYFVWEIPDCERSLSMLDFTTIWEEHIHYFTSFTFKQMLENSGFNIIHYESVPYPLENSLTELHVLE